MRFSFIFLVMFLCPVALAVPSINFQHENITVGETILAKINTSGEFSEKISKSQISFFEGRKKVFFDFDIAYFNKSHYFYAYTTRPGKFTLKISDVLYLEESQLKSQNIEKVLDISPAANDSEVLSIRPGFLEGFEDSKLKITNLGSIVSNFTYEGGEVSLQPNDFIEMIVLKNLTGILKVGAMKTFEIPLLFVSPNETIDFWEENKLKLGKTFLISNVFVNEKNNYSLLLYNSGEDNITDISFKSNISFIEFGDFEDLLPLESRNISLNIFTNASGHVKGFVYIYFNQSGQRNITVPIELYITPRENNETDFEVSDKTCSEQNGTVCAYDQKCNGNSKFTLGGEYCCMTSCSQVKDGGGSKGENSGLLWGILIFVILGIGGFYFYNKSKRVTNKSPEEKLKEVSKNYSNRIQGGLQRN